MNYERHLVAVTTPGKVGESWAIIHQSSKKVDVLKISPEDGLSPITLSKKKFKQFLSNGFIEVVEQIPGEIFRGFKNDYNSLVENDDPEE